MSNPSGIHAPAAPVPRVAGRARDQLAVTTASPSPSAASSPSTPPSTAPASHAGPEGVADRLGERLAALPGSDREVTILYDEEESAYVVEIRDRETGQLLQRFPPEIFLNQPPRPADLLGRVIDRRS
jgi:hypothetical protein